MGFLLNITQKSAVLYHSSVLYLCIAEGAVISIGKFNEDFAKSNLKIAKISCCSNQSKAVTKAVALSKP